MAIAPLRPYQSLTSVVFIDGALPDLQTILSGLDPSVTAIVLDLAQDGIQQMADALAGMNGWMPFTSSRMAPADRSTSA